MKELKSCGILLFDSARYERFLLLRHASRYDLPKGHKDRGEDDLACALRETWEETGIESDQISLDDNFRCEIVYFPRYKRFCYEPVKKTLVMFLGHLIQDVDIDLTEHFSFEWVTWAPPHRIQEQSIDQVLAEVEQYFSRRFPSTL